MAADRRSYRLKKSPKCLLFRSLRAVMAQLFTLWNCYISGKKRTGLAKKLDLKPYKNEDKHILQEPGRGEGGNTDI